MASLYIDFIDGVVQSKSTKNKLLYYEGSDEYSDSKAALQTDDIKEAAAKHLFSETQDTDVEEDEEDTCQKDEEDSFWLEEKQEKFEKWFSQYRKQPKDIFSIPYGVGIGTGKSLVEVFEVRIISDVKMRQKLNIHGTITLCASYGKDDIFRRMRESPEMILPEGTLTLTGPEIAAPGYDVNTIELDLKDGRREVCKGQLIMNYYEWHESDYDWPLIGKVEGANRFSAEVTYATFSEALVVSVEIKLPKIKTSNYIKVYGKIEASISGLRGFTPNVKTTLFKKKRKNCVSISADKGVIPLFKSLLACPTEGALELHLNIASTKAHIARARVNFKPKCFGGKEVLIDSEYGPISFLFTVYHPDFHPASLDAYKYSFWRYMWPKECQ